MSNFEIIINAAIEAGIYTEEQAIEIIEECGRLPLHTFAEWKRMGYQVRKGEKASMTCHIWKPKKNAKQEDEEGIEIRRDFYLTKAFFFMFSQVEPIAQH